MSDYREGGDPEMAKPKDPAPEPNEPDEKKAQQAFRVDPRWITQTEIQEPPPPPAEDIDDPQEVYTAVMLVQGHDGHVLPVTALGGLKLHHRATPAEVIRMCLDIADQLSGVRVVSEVIRNFRRLTQQGMKDTLEELFARSPAEEAQEEQGSEEDREPDTELAEGARG